MTFTNADKLACVERELELRERVYLRLINKNKMSPKKAEREISLMTAIASDYRILASADEPEMAMFIETRQTVEPHR